MRLSKNAIPAKSTAPTVPFINSAVLCFPRVFEIQNEPDHKISTNRRIAKNMEICGTASVNSRMSLRLYAVVLAALHQLFQ